MPTYDVKIWQTAETKNHSENNGYNSDEALQRAKTYIEGAFGYVDHAGVNVSLGNDVIPAPTQATQTSFEATSPCFGSRSHFDYLLHWWQEKLNCEISESKADDSNLLISAGNNPGGGFSETSTDGNTGTVSAGKYLPEVAESYQEYTPYTSSSSEWASVMSVLHELGHNIMEGGTNHHNRGSTTYSLEYSGWCYSPIGSSVGDTNECGEDHESNTIGRMLYYGDCAQCVMTKGDGNLGVCN